MAEYITHEQDPDVREIVAISRSKSKEQLRKEWEEFKEKFRKEHPEIVTAQPL